MGFFADQVFQDHPNEIHPDDVVQEMKKASVQEGIAQV